MKRIEYSWQNDVKERHTSVICSLYLLTPSSPPLPPRLLSSSSGQRETDVKVMNEIVSLILFATQIFTFCLILLPLHAIILHMFPLTTCKFPYLIVLFTNWTPLEFKICHVIFHLFLPLRPDKVGPCCYCVAPPSYSYPHQSCQRIFPFHSAFFFMPH